jgi:hypothetical protein
MRQLYLQMAFFNLGSKIPPRTTLFTFDPGGGAGPRLRPRWDSNPQQKVVAKSLDKKTTMVAHMTHRSAR